MRGLSARERLLISVVVAGAFVALFYLFSYSRAVEEQGRLRAELTKVQAEFTRLDRLAKTREAKEAEFATLQERIRLVEVTLPPEREIPRLIRQLQDVAQELKVKFTLLRPGPTQAPAQAGPPSPPAAQRQPTPPAGQQPKAAPIYQEFRIDMGFDGTYADLMAYLGRLEQFPRFLVLTTLSLAPGDLPRLKVTIAGKTFVLPREPQATTTQ